MTKVSDLKIRDNEYWIDRAEIITKRNGKIGDSKKKDIAIMFKDSKQEMGDNIQAFYAKYGKVADSPTFKTLPNGTKVLSGEAKKLVVSAAVAEKILAKGTRLNKLERNLDEILLAMSSKEQLIMADGLTATARGMYYDSMYETYRGVGVGQSFNLLTESQIQALIEHEVNGEVFSARIWDNTNKLANTVNQTLKAGITQGVSNNEMVKRIMDQMNVGHAVANRLLRTEVTNSLNQASLASYNNSGIVDMYEYVATLDNRTSDVCADLDGEVFSVKNATTGLNFPPMHPNCRSTTVASFDGSKAGMTRIARGLDGNTFTVPADMTTNEFRAIYVDGNLSRSQYNKGGKVPAKAKPKPISKPKASTKKWVVLKDDKLVKSFDTKKEASVYGINKRKKGDQVFVWNKTEANKYRSKDRQL